MPDIIGEIQRKYQEIEKAKPPREPRGTRPIMPITAPQRMPITAPRSMPLPKGPQLVPPLQREIRRRMVPIPKKRILPKGTIIRTA